MLHLSFLQDPGQPPDPDIYYAGQGLLLTTNTYEGLLQYKAGTDKPELEPLLATEWKASPDNKVFDFKLREGVKFHDGTPFTAEAVKASFDRRLAVDQGPAYMVKDVESVTPQGDYDVTITLKAPNAAFLDYLACAYGPRMLSPAGTAAERGRRSRAELPDQPRSGDRPVHAHRAPRSDRATRWRHSRSTGAPSRTSRRSRCR